MRNIFFALTIAAAMSSCGPATQAEPRVVILKPIARVYFTEITKSSNYEYVLWQVDPLTKEIQTTAVYGTPTTDTIVGNYHIFADVAKGDQAWAKITYGQHASYNYDFEIHLHKIEDVVSTTTPQQ